jgi:hypothetical protein
MLIYNATINTKDPTIVILQTIKKEKNDPDIKLEPGQVKDLATILPEEQLKTNMELIQNLEVGLLRIIDKEQLKSRFEQITQPRTVDDVKTQEPIQEKFLQKEKPSQEELDAKKTEASNPVPPTPQDNSNQPMIKDEDLELSTEQVITDEPTPPSTPQGQEPKEAKSKLDEKSFPPEKQNTLAQVANTSSISLLEDYVNMYAGKDPDIVQACQARLKELDSDEIESPELN